MKKYCEVCKNKYDRLCDRLNEEVFCICPSCGFKDSDDMTDEEIERWDDMKEKLCSKLNNE
jgi:hypothetical protein